MRPLFAESNCCMVEPDDFRVNHTQAKWLFFLDESDVAYSSLIHSIRPMIGHLRPLFGLTQVTCFFLMFLFINKLIAA